MFTTTIWQLLALACVFLGLIGAILPALPGAPLIWLGALLWAWADGFHHVGAPTLIVLAALAALSWGADLVVSAWITRRAGGGWRTVVVAIMCGLAGALLLGGLIPLIGPFVGTMAGAAFGIVLLEYRRQRKWREAWRIASAYVLGYLVASLVQIAICLLMIVIFVWQAFL